MKATESLVTNYEACRVEVNRLFKERAGLILRCKKQEAYFASGQQGNPPEICLKAALDELRENQHEDYPYDHSYQEVLENGAYCENCIESYRIKVGPLAAARQAFGSAKRALSARAKLLNKGEAA